MSWFVFKSLSYFRFILSISGKEGPGFETLLQIYGCAACSVLFATTTAADEHRRQNHDGKKSLVESLTIDSEIFRYEEGAQSLLEQRGCSACKIYFLKPALKDEHVKKFHSKSAQDWKLKSDLKPAHTPGEEKIFDNWPSHSMGSLPPNNFTNSHYLFFQIRCHFVGSARNVSAALPRN